MRIQFLIKALLAFLLTNPAIPALAAQGKSTKIQINSYEPVMVTIPAGHFVMGEQSNESEKNETPLHSVSIRSFNLSKTEITVEQYRQFVLASGYVGGDTCHGSNFKELPLSWSSPEMSPTPSHPVVCVNWNDAKAYAKWLTQKTGKKYRLPTEAEWEYSARANSVTKYFFGNEESLICTYGNFRDSAKNSSANCNDHASFTAAVGSYKSNGFGLYDMAGNVWEWTEDCYQKSYAGAPTDGSAWLIGECNTRVQRGGSWFDFPIRLRSANRFGGKLEWRDSALGFRVAQDLNF